MVGTRREQRGSCLLSYVNTYRTAREVRRITGGIGPSTILHPAATQFTLRGHYANNTFTRHVIRVCAFSHHVLNLARAMH